MFGKKQSGPTGVWVYLLYSLGIRSRITVSRCRMTGVLKFPAASWTFATLKLSFGRVAVSMWQQLLGTIFLCRCRSVSLSGSNRFICTQYWLSSWAPCRTCQLSGGQNILANWWLGLHNLIFSKKYCQVNLFSLLSWVVRLFAKRGLAIVMDIAHETSLPNSIFRNEEWHLVYQGITPS